MFGLQGAFLAMDLAKHCCVGLDPLFNRFPGKVVILRCSLVYVVRLPIPSIFLMLVDLESF